MQLPSRQKCLIALLSFIIGGCASFKSKSVATNHSRHAISSPLSKWTLREKIGQLLIIGYRDSAQIGDVLPGGVAMFSWSMKSVDQTRQLTKEIRELAKQKLKAPLLIATDHEGGRVIRLRNGMTLFPEASAVGASGNTDLSKRVGYAVGEELAYLGINANFAPVLDLGGAESFLGNRIWGEDPEQVARMTGAYIQGLQESGVMSVAKHFPGHGASSDDAHFGTPVSHKNLSRLWNEDFHPFQQAVIERVPAMMTAHVRVPEVDRLPASMSSRFLSRILRDTFKFDGVIITDDLEMKGAQESMLSPGDLALQALIAGSDMLLVVWSKPDQRIIIDRIEKAIRSGEWSEAELDRKLERILAMKSHWVDTPTWESLNSQAASPMRSSAHLQLIKEIADQPVRWLGPQSAAIRMKLRVKWNQAWRVAVPQGSYANFWRKWRPQDTVVILERRLNSQALNDVREKFSPSACIQVTCLMLTEAANQSSPDLYQHMQTVVGVAKTVSDTRSPATPGGALIWAHMGLAPAVESINERSTIALLGSSGVNRLQRFASDLTRQANP